MCSSIAMSDKRICIVTDQHLSANPRVWKEADALARNGYEVEIITRANNAKRKQRDQKILENIHNSIKYSPVVNAIKEEISFFRDFYYRARLKFVLFIKRFGFDSRYLLSTDPDLIYTEALNRNADLYIAHVECGLYVGKHLLQKGKKVAFDFEDWYSNDYLSPVRAVKLLQQLESYALHNGAFVTCPSAAMAKALQQTYNVPDQPQVIYNGFKDDDAIVADIHEDDGLVKLVWFSQRIGPGRGLEKFIETLKNVSTPISLTLIGDCPEEYEALLNNIFPADSGHRLVVVKPVTHAQLGVLLRQFDVGLALEEVYPESRNKTITNKILQYLQAGIKVLATNTDGQVEVAKHMQGAVATIAADNNSGWSDVLQQLIGTHVDKEVVIKKYQEQFSWYAQEEKLLQLVETALKTNT